MEQNQYNGITEPPKEQPELQRILTLFRKANNDLMDVTSECVGYGGSLKPMPAEGVPIAPSLLEEPLGVVDQLWAEVQRIRSQNLELVTLAAHLRSVIGS